MNPTLLTSGAKEALRRTVRGLRGQLIQELTEAAEREYHLGTELKKAKLPEARRCRRERLEAWLSERARTALGVGKGEKKGGAAAEAAFRARFLGEAAEEAAHTLLNRLVLIRILEHHGVLTPAVVTGGAKSPGYEKEFMGYAGPLASDDTRGYWALLQVLFAELSLDLPGLFGPVGLTPLFPVPAAMLRELVQALNDPALDSAWGDDTTLGWVYQYWNDPQREALDKKIADGGKIEPHEIASKTQMFTERYMVEWLLQNSLGLSWLTICKKNGWAPDADAVLPVLEARRAAFRARREAGDVALDALMPIESELEAAWKYYVPQPIPAGAMEKAPASIRELRLLDPACGSGHFLVIAFDLLARLHEEEARHRGEATTREQIAEQILERNLHGIDIDSRAIQIAAAALWLKAKLFAPNARLRTVNLVAPALRLGRLPASDPALERLEQDLEREVGVPRALTEKLVLALTGVDHLGTLLRVDRAIDEALRQADVTPGPLFVHAAARAKGRVLDKLEAFLAQHSASEDLGVRLDGEQLEAGVRFVRLAKEGSYDIVVGNPPYQGLSKTASFDYVVKQYLRGKADLYAAFLERGLELVREGGLSAMVTMQGWMFLSQFSELRRSIVHDNSVRCLADLAWCAFENMRHATVAMAVVMRGAASGVSGFALMPTPREEREESIPALFRKRAAVLAQVGRYEFDPKGFAVIDGEPIVYWWTKEFLERYAKAPKLGEVSPAHAGLSTQNNNRFVRQAWEVAHHRTLHSRGSDTVTASDWVPYVKGASGAEWMEPLQDVLFWEHDALQLRLWIDDYKRRIPGQYIKNERDYFSLGVAFAAIGAGFSARAHRYASVFGHMGASVFPHQNRRADVLCILQSALARRIVQALNPTVHFGSSDVNRLPLFSVESAEDIFATIETAFTEHESHRESSVEFKFPGPSPWRYAQAWAQQAVDRAEGAPLPAYQPEHDPPDPAAHVSFAIGVALGRFGANGEGILDKAPPDALPAGILFVGPGDSVPDSLTPTEPAQPAIARLEQAWEAHGAAITPGKRVALRDWLRKDFFAYHKGLYESRPIYFPLSSEKKAFVAWISIHRWTDQTLPTLLADHVHPILRKLDGEIADLNTARASSDKKTAQAADKQFAVAKRARDELADFATLISQCAERGAPPTDAACPPRKADATFHMDLDDGVMINSAALWPLLAPQWADLKKWWKQLCTADGKKDYDWAHLARRYFPDRVDAKCKTDPSLAVAHACFWAYHPAKAYAWELRLQHEIRPDFTIDEPGSNEARAAYLAAFPQEAATLREKEKVRRERAKNKTADDSDAADEADVAGSEEEL